VTRGEDGKGGGGRFKGLGGLISVAQEVLNKSLREVESERGLVVVVVIFVCVGVWCFVFGIGALLGHVLIMTVTRTVTGYTM
jgi:hypothetical protein